MKEIPVWCMYYNYNVFDDEPLPIEPTRHGSVFRFFSFYCLRLNLSRFRIRSSAGTILLGFEIHVKFIKMVWNLDPLIVKKFLSAVIKRIWIRLGTSHYCFFSFLFFSFLCICKYFCTYYILGINTLMCKYFCCKC